MSRSASKVLEHARPIFILANPDCRRVDRFQAALQNLGMPAATILPWVDFLSGTITLPEAIPADAIVRIETPGTYFETERALLALGADIPDEDVFDRLPREAAASMEFDKGRIVCPRQWYRGFRAALQEVERQLTACPPHTRMNAPADIAVMFDKLECQERLRAAGVPVPRSLGVIASYDDLMARMHRHNIRRVFVKLAHGSSASGMVAYRVQGERHQAITTVEMTEQNGVPVLYNSRKIRTHTDPHTITALIDALCRHRTCAEEWIPKAGMDGHAFDLRVVVIAGKACHTIARLSRHPMTNLHLLNQRRAWETTRAHIGEVAAEEARQTCERVMALFPSSLYAGIDLMFPPGFRRCYVLEANAFGDLLPGTLHVGQDTYTAEIRAMLGDLS